MGVRNHIGKIIRSSTNPTITPAEKFFELVCLLMKLKRGVKMNAKIKEITIEMKIGFKTRTARATKILRSRTVAVFLTIGSCILL